MSWWEEQIQNTSQSPWAISAITAIVTSILTTYRRNPKMKFIQRVTEALTCALLSLGLTKAGVLYFSLSPDWAVPVAVFVSWIGTDQIKIVLAKLFEKYIAKN